MSEFKVIKVVQEDGSTVESKLRRKSAKKKAKPVQPQPQPQPEPEFGSES